ncbi:MAG: DUF3105 domain-containing protein, partial [Candidatus Limnocylindrales bacterium]
HVTRPALTTPPRRTPPSSRARGSRIYRAAPPKSFMERNRTKLLWGLAGLAVVVMAGLAFLGATSPAYACTTEWKPAPAPSPAPSATPRLGIVEDDMGREHVSLGSFVRYALCPPASGKHYNAQGEGPVRAGMYGPDDQATPQGWIHNLEHGGLVILYRCATGDTACDDAGQSALKQLNTNFPNSPICNLPPGSVGPVITRFDQMAWPYAALVWGVVMPMDTLDPQLVKDFFAQQGERSNPEPLCAKPTAAPASPGTPSPSAAGSASPAPSGSPAPSLTLAPSASPVPSPSPAPTAS